jgi:ATP-dependent DNA ligase
MLLEIAMGVQKPKTSARPGFPYPPMEARTADEIPDGDGWLYEPKWDGFRCLAFKDESGVVLQSKSGQPLGRYFPEIVDALAALPAKQFVLDGEIVIFAEHGTSFDDLLQRIHPADSRVRKLAAQTPSTYLVFDLLVDARGTVLTDRQLADRRTRLDAFFDSITSPRVQLSPATRKHAEAAKWMRDMGTMGLDGVIAKRIELPYRSGERDGMVKVKRIRTADCIVAGFRYASKGKSLGSLLLGLMNDEGAIDHVGFTSSFTREERDAVAQKVLPLRGGKGFTGRAPGGQSRWSTERSGEWEPLKPTLVCEVRYDHYSGGRFRHGTKFLRWRPDKKPAQCTFDQVVPRARNSASSARDRS